VPATVRPGREWLHDVTIVDYDYLSKNSRGGFADIDRLVGLIAPPIVRKWFWRMGGMT
jgi:hypothetical protein